MPETFSSIVVGTDGSQCAGEAVRRAISIALRLGAQLQIVSAYEPEAGLRLGIGPAGGPDPEWQVGPHDAVVALLERAQGEALDSGVADVQTFARQGDAADAIIDVAEEQGADLIVVGNKGMSGARRFLLGSVPNRVSHLAPCSVLIVRTS